VSSLAARADPDLVRVWQWFCFQREMLDEAQSHIAAAARLVFAVAGASRPYDRQFTGQTVDEVDAFFTAQLAELEWLTSFELLATVEACLRLDFQNRVDTKRKDVVSRVFRDIAKRGSRVRLDEDILETWKTEHGVSVAPLRGALNLRNWLAHGRHYHPKLGQKYNPDDVYRISTQFLGAIAL
jgi:hypothetical protein